MRTLFVMDPLDRINVAGDSTYMLMLDLCERGLPVAFCTPADLLVEAGRPLARCQAVAVGRSAPHFQAEPPQDRPLGDFDVVWMRKDPPFDIEYIFATYILELAPPSTRVFNRPASLRDFNEKMAIFRWPQHCVPTLVTSDIPRAVDFARRAPGKVVLKPWDGNGGRGVLVSEGRDGNLRSMLELLTEEGRRAILIQHYIPAIEQGDKRIILVDGEPGGAILRVPQPGDHRGNMHAGARVQACELDEADRRICADLGPVLRERGLLFVGIDVIGGFLTEVNVTSPTGIQEIERLGGRSLHREINDRAIALARSA